MDGCADQVDHGREGCGVPMAPSARPGGLEQAVQAFETGGGRRPDRDLQRCPGARADPVRPPLDPGRTLAAVAAGGLLSGPRYPVDLKYQNQGGPGLSDLIRLLKGSDRPPGRPHARCPIVRVPNRADSRPDCPGGTGRHPAICPCGGGCIAPI